MKLLRSFQLRIALISAATSAVILAGFGSMAWWRLRQSRLEALDREMEAIGDSLAIAAKWEMSKTDVDKVLQRHFGEERRDGWIFALSESAKAPQLSTKWPANLSPAVFAHDATIQWLDIDRGERFRSRMRPPLPRQEREEVGFEPDDRPPPPPPERIGRTSGKGPGMAPTYKPAFYTTSLTGKTYRLGVFGHSESGRLLHIGLDLDSFAKDITSITRSFWLALPGALLLIAVGAWIAARRSLKPIDALSQRMERLSLAQLEDRLDDASADREFGRIIKAWNDMLSRLQRSYEQATRFSADASHELKTPLAVMRGTIEESLRHCPDGSQEQRTYASLLDELDHQQAILEALLLLSRADSGKLGLSAEKVLLNEWLQPLLEDAGLMAEEKALTLTHEIADPLWVKADPVLLYRAIHNLFRNAVAYNRPEGRITCQLRRYKDLAELIITNTGEAIPESDRSRVFERFSRGSNVGGTGEGKGLGIGLSLAKEIIQAHGGSLTLGPCHDDLTTMVVRLPLC